ncbi:MAG: helix-hairpin-helix domain-containing protein [Rhodoluna sp.]|nr:helix-hairpin-helix domain-containing protein [Rhodoluna sp.]MBP6186150.1 helix-hairpin-helix domain-containing protein [Rhodoluna sp.]
MKSLREKAIEALGTATTMNRKVLLLLFLILVAIGAILVALNSPKPYAGSSQDQNITVQPAGSEFSMSAAENFVHLVGEVANPGIYKLPSGSRLFDAVLAAGGFSAAADQASVNLARELSDGEQIVVLAIGGNQLNGQGVAQGAGASAQTSLISLNRASQIELETLPGVGPALASRMVDWRVTNGGFKKKQDLMKVSGIGQKLFTGIENLVTL